MTSIQGQPSQFTASAIELDKHVAGTAGVAGMLQLLQGIAKETMTTAQDKGLLSHAAEAATAATILNTMAAQMPVALYKLANAAAAVAGDGSNGMPSALYRSMRQVVAHARPDLASTAPRWEGEAAADKTLLVHCTNGQGFGDTFMFAGLLQPLLRSGAVGAIAYEVQKPLKSLFRNLANDTGRPITVFARGEELPAHDLVIPNMDLHQAMGINLQRYRAEPAFFKTPEVIAAEHQAWIQKEVVEPQQQGKTVICLAWQGDKGNIALEPARSCPLDNLLPIIMNDKIKVISVQAGYGSEQVAALPEAARGRITLVPETFDKQAGAFYDTAHLMSKVDAVVTTDTATAHIAGGLGVRTLLMLPLVSELRWPCAPTDSRATQTPFGAYRTPHNYYSNMTLFTQSVPGFWSPVAESVAHELTSTQQVAQARLKQGPKPAVA